MNYKQQSNFPRLLYKIIILNFIRVNNVNKLSINWKINLY